MVAAVLALRGLVPCPLTILLARRSLPWWNSCLIVVVVRPPIRAGDVREGGGVVGRGRALWMSPIIECVGVMSLGRMVTRFALTGAMLVFGRRARVGRERKSRMHCARRVVSL